MSLSLSLSLPALILAKQRSGPETLGGAAKTDRDRGFRSRGGRGQRERPQALRAIMKHCRFRGNSFFVPPLALVVPFHFFLRGKNLEGI